ncbi:hypothetical protein [Pseudorhizobium pelagicum]|uniref:Uncharacterized protein n=1 Tax=Pseudorhizobium pelagicum TaxID=1509405 RepID=A0A922T5F4_9HYPH|nr:hypothetical protein [Pseudorhizobium pelagicum]KEQ05742.1 hypothetical protein GV67_04100 [Pseudorhizobium pelagicum]KEQ06422.1 hypothetical protein GV68_07095 [Pseudorhizobium pelagicum]
MSVADDGPLIINVGGQQVDVNDPCALYRALKAYRIKLAAGERVEEVEIRSPVTTRRTRFSSGSKPEDLDRMLSDAKAACELTLGERPKRTRYAIGGRFRPY